MFEKLNYADESALRNDVQEIMLNADDAFELYKKTRPAQRTDFLETIAGEVEKLRPDLVSVASEETNLSAARLNNELSRTGNQLRMFAALIKEGSWVEASIDTANTDLRRMLVPMGPVVVFGASNFPFAFSTAGGDTASALASGCSV